MNKYMEYLKDNPKGYWFKRKIYGWGWTPVKWEGWAFLLIWIALFVEFIHLTEKLAANSKESFSLMIIPVVTLIALLFLIGHGTGERPKWTWGLEKNQRSDRQKTRNQKKR